MERIFWGVVVVALIPLIIFWKFIIEPIAWVFDRIMDLACDHKIDFLAVLIAGVFLSAQILAVHLLVENPKVQKSINNYKRECGAPGFPDCQ